MKISTLIIGVVFSSFSLFGSTVSADSMRCSNKLINSGDTSSEVRMLCGEPFEKEYVGSVEIRGKHVNLDRYTYVPTKGKLIKILDFHDGILVKINNGRRVE